MLSFQPVFALTSWPIPSAGMSDFEPLETHAPSVQKGWRTEHIRPLVQESSSVIQAPWNLGQLCCDPDRNPAKPQPPYAMARPGVARMYIRRRHMIGFHIYTRILRCKEVYNGSR